MSISVDEAKKLISLLKSLQPAMDSVGKSRRDLLFELKQRDELDETVYNAFTAIDRMYLSVLSQADSLESAALIAIKDALPEGSETP